MKNFLEFDDAGATDDHPAKGVTVGDIRAWHDEAERLKTDATESHIARLEAALQSIAGNTCCDNCREASMVARAALASYVGLSRETPDEGLSPHKVMTRAEYHALNLQGWHMVCHNVDGFGGVGIRYLGHRAP